MKYLALVFVFVLAIGLVCAVNGWGDINSGNGSDAPPPVINNTDVDEPSDVVSDYVAPDYSDNESGWVYTDNFYIALGLGGFGLLIVIYFIYLFFRKPRNKWKS
jgi:hypothetical protein